MPVERGPGYYKMNHNRRGMAIIFNHEDFDNPSLKRRFGTNVDRDNLKHTLNGLGFEVTVYNDLKTEELMNIVVEG
jgi:caspase-like apoptosis-related cysteine protease